MDADTRAKVELVRAHHLSMPRMDDPWNARTILLAALNTKTQEVERLTRDAKDFAYARDNWMTQCERYKLALTIAEARLAECLKDVR